MDQKIPQSPGPLLNASAVAIGGLGIHGVTMGVVVNTGAVLGVDRAALDLTNNNYEAGKTTMKNLNAQMKTDMMAASHFTRLFRELLKPTLGARYSETWNQAGFIGRLAIPRTPQKLAPMLLSIKAYLTANVGFQNTELDMTPARAEALEQSLVDDQTAVNLQETEVQRLKGLRDAAAKKLRNRLCALVEEVGRLIGPMDERWLALGLNRPGQKVRPPTPEKLVHVLVGKNSISIKWDAAARAEHYRIWKRVVGSEDTLLPAGNAGDTNFLIEGLPANSKVEIAVSAVNNGGESALTEVIVVQTLA